MKIFSDQGFAKGAWAGALRKKLQPPSIVASPVIPGWKPEFRIWRGTFQKWIQFQPQKGAFFWSGKPAVLSSPTALYAGYYVERGYPPDRPKTEASQTMRPGWHWYGFYRVLSEKPLQGGFSAVLGSLTDTRRCIWVSQPTSKEPTGSEKDFSGQVVLASIKEHIDQISPDEWIDVVVGARYLKDECLSVQDQIVPEIMTALKKGAELYELVLAALSPPATQI